MKTSVLVTGATGFLGEHLCRALVAQGHIVRGLARSRSSVLEELGVEHVRGDVMNADEVDRALDGVSLEVREGELFGLLARARVDDGWARVRLLQDVEREVGALRLGELDGLDG